MSTRNKSSRRYFLGSCLAATTASLTCRSLAGADGNSAEQDDAPVGQDFSLDPPVKKLVEYGWDVPYPNQVRKDIRAMEKKPFDGIIFRLREWNHAFDPRPWNEAKLKPQFDDLAAIEWNVFTDNFLCLYAANHWKMDWFDDAQWKGIVGNLRLSAKAARIGRCVGIVFDPEPYGDNPWAYVDRHEGRGFAEVEARARKRGAQFMTAIQEELPDARILTFFHQSLFVGVVVTIRVRATLMAVEAGPEAPTITMLPATTT